MGDVSLHRPVKAEPAAVGIVAQGNEMTDLMSPGWTDERHTLYISSMESSFMDQLYKRGGRGANQNDSTASGFKVLRGGVWEKLEFERTIVRAPVTGKCLLPANPWIQHFRPRDCSSNARGDGAESSAGDHESGIRTTRGKDPVSHGRELGACKTESLLGENTEVSDQNFAEDEAEVDVEPSKLCKKKRRLSGTSTYCAPTIK